MVHAERARVIGRGVAAGLAQDRLEAARSRGGHRIGEPGRQRVEPSERARRARPVDAQRRPDLAARGALEQRMADRHVESGVLGEAGADELHGATVPAGQPLFAPPPRVTSSVDGSSRVPLGTGAGRDPGRRWHRRVPRLGAAPRARRRTHARRGPRASLRGLRRAQRARAGGPRRRLRLRARRPRAPRPGLPPPARRPSRTVPNRRPAPVPWTDSGWHGGTELERAVLYELHVGTFTDEGTFDAAIEHLPELAQLGVTHIELMPVAEFPGTRGWGYDGVYISAAQSSYGGPLGLQRLVDAAHGAGLGVILDVVYNHVGASGVAAMEAFGPYFTESTRRSGARRSTTTTPTATRCASGCCRAPRAGSATSTSTACASMRSTRSSTRAPSTSFASWRSACTRATTARS